MPTFALDKPNAKLAGVCAGLARTLELDPLLVRALTALIALFAPIVILCYALAAWLAPKA